MTTIPQDAPINKRQMIILAMRGSQDAMKRAIEALTVHGTAGEIVAAKEMKLASHYARAASILMDPSTERRRAL